MSAQVALRDADRCAANLDRWAELTALAVELRKALLAGTAAESEIEKRVWMELRAIKEREWTSTSS